jgi:hypothetical protein
MVLLSQQFRETKISFGSRLSSMGTEASIPSFKIALYCC